MADARRGAGRAGGPSAAVRPLCWTRATPPRSGPERHSGAADAEAGSLPGPFPGSAAPDGTGVSPAGDGERVNPARGGLESTRGVGAAGRRPSGKPDVVALPKRMAFVHPSFSGRPSTPTFAAWPPPASARCHLIPVCVQSSTSAAASASSRLSRPSGVVDSHRNSFTRRGEPWHITTECGPSRTRWWAGSVPSQARCSGAVCS